MARFVQGKDGKMAGSVGDGKDRLPTVSDLPAGTVLEDENRPVGYDDLYARFTKVVATSDDPAADDEQSGFVDEEYETFKRESAARAAEMKERGAAILAKFDQTQRLSRRSVMTERGEDGLPNMAVLIEYAADPVNRRRVEALRAEYASGSTARRDSASVPVLDNVIAKGKIKQADLAAEAEEQKDANKKRGSVFRIENNLNVSGNYTLMRPSKGVLEGKLQSVADVHPELARQWHPDNPCGPHEVSAGGSSMQVLWLCDQCGYEWTNQYGNRLRPWQRGEGRYESCPNCAKRSRYNASRSELQRIMGQLQTDPDAFDRLPPAVREAILIKMGIIRGNGEFAAVGTAIARGDITLKDVLDHAAADGMIDRIDFDATMADDADRELTDDEMARLSDTAARHEADTVDGRVDQILATADYAGIVASDQAIVDQIVNSGVRELWNEVHNNPGADAGILARVQAQIGSGGFQSVVAERFAGQLRAAQAFDMPEGYNAVRTNDLGETYEIQPFLTQKQFALQVAEQRRVVNLSGTGAGKTISAILASRHIGAQETVVFVPATLTGQWEKEIRLAYPDTDVQVRLPNVGEDLDASRKDGKPRVWVVSYGALSNDADQAGKRLKALSGRTDMVIMDEAHLVKDRSTTVTSARREELERFTRAAARSNADLAVVGMTATPVMNDLDEASSLVKLVTGKGARFRTAATKANALAAHKVMTDLGVRYMPAYLKNVDRVDRVIPLDETAMTEVAKEYHRLSKSSRRNDVSTPAKIERALLPAKMPALLDEVRASDGPVLVYTEYTSGMVDPMVARFQAEGITVAQFTGNETKAEKKDVLQRFRRGEIKVLIGSSAVATGVDGLQDVCSTVIDVCPPWTAAQEEQMIGRVNRTGQTRKVRVVNLLTEADLGEGLTWSFDKDRHARLTFKRGLGDAVTDGVIPQGHAGESAKVTTRAAEALVGLFERLGASGPSA